MKTESAASQLALIYALFRAPARALELSPAIHPQNLAPE